MQHFQIGGLGEMVRHPGHHDRWISPHFDFFLWGYVKDKVFLTPVPDITNLEGKDNGRFCYNNWRRVGEHVERNWLSIRRSPCNKRNTCWSVQICCKKSSWVTLKIYLYSTYSSFLVINICNQGKTMLTLYVSGSHYWACYPMEKGGYLHTGNETIAWEWYITSAMGKWVLANVSQLP